MEEVVRTSLGDFKVVAAGETVAKVLLPSRRTGVGIRHSPVDGPWRLEACPLRGTWRLGARPMGGPVGERPQSGAQSLSGFRSESRSRLARWATLATFPNEISHQPAGTNEQLALLCWDSAPRTMG